MDLYFTLGLSKDASEEDIKKAFRKLAQTCHPDKNQGPASEERFKEINTAYQVLGDSKKRALWDEFGEESLAVNFDPRMARMRGMKGFHGYAPSQGPVTDFDAMFADIFGPGAPRRKRPASPTAAPIRYDSEQIIDFMSAINGCELRIVSGPLVWMVKVPAGVSDGDKLRCKHSSPRVGDLYLTIRIAAHAHFKRMGQNLYVDMPLTAGEAYHGAQVHVPSPGGGGVLTVQPRTQSGTIMRVLGKGVLKQGHAPGDLYIRWIIAIPMDDSVETQRAVDGLTVRMGNPREGMF